MLCARETSLYLRENCFILMEEKKGKNPYSFSVFQLKNKGENPYSTSRV